MPLPVAGILGTVLAFVLARVISRIILALGISTVTYIGLDYAFSQLLAEVADLVSSLPPQLMQVVALLQLQRALQLMAAIVIAKVSINGLKQVVVQ